MTAYIIHYTKEKLFMLSAKGNSDAMYSIGYRYLEGIGGLPKNSLLATQWFKKAADAGNSNALKILEKLSPPSPVAPQAKIELPSQSKLEQSSNPNSNQKPNQAIDNDQPTVIQTPLASLMSEVTAQSYPEIHLPKTFSADSALSLFAYLMLMMWLIKRLLNKRNYKKITQYIARTDQHIDLLINKHLKTLALKYKQTIKQDDYGNIFYDQWEVAMEYFLTHVLAKQTDIKQLLDRETYFKNTNEKVFLKQKKLSKAQKNAFELYKRSPTRIGIKEKITQAVRHYQSIEAGTDYKEVNVDLLSPLAFEHYCADILSANGWKARVTQASGDQGIDIIAQYANINVAFQCKKYSSAIGNQAVQQIIAGKQYIRADIAAVVSNAKYTHSAKQLASSTGVYLLHYSELKTFKDRLLQSAA